MGNAKFVAVLTEKIWRGVSKILRPGKEITAPEIQDISQINTPAAVANKQPVTEAMDPQLLADHSHLQQVDFFKLQTDGVVKAERNRISAKQIMSLTRAVAPLTLLSLGSVAYLITAWSLAPVTVALSSALAVGVFGYFAVLTFTFLRNVKAPLVHALNPDTSVQRIAQAPKPVEIQALASTQAARPVKKSAPVFKVRQPVHTTEKTTNQGAPEDADQRHLWNLPYLNLRPVIASLGAYKISIRPLNSISDFKISRNGSNIHVWVNPKHLEAYQVQNGVAVLEQQIAEEIQDATQSEIKAQLVQNALPALFQECNRVLKETLIIDNDSAQYHWDTTRGQFNRQSRWLAKSQIFKKGIDQFFRNASVAAVAPSDRMRGILANLVSAKECTLFKLDYALDETIRRLFPDDTAEILAANALKQAILERDEIKDQLNGITEGLLQAQTPVEMINRSQLLTNYLNHQLLALGVDHIPQEYAQAIGNVNQFLAFLSEQFANVLVEETLMRAVVPQSFQMMLAQNKNQAALADYVSKLLPLIYPEILTDKNLTLADIQKREQTLKKLIVYLQGKSLKVSKAAEVQLQKQDNFKNPTPAELMSFMQYSAGMIFEQRTEKFDFKAEGCLPDLMQRGVVQARLPILEKILMASDKKKDGWLLGNGGLRRAVINQVVNVLPGGRPVSGQEEQHYRSRVASQDVVAEDREFLKEIIYQKMVDFWERYYLGLEAFLKKTPAMSIWDAEELFFRNKLDELAEALKTDADIQTLLEQRVMRPHDSALQTAAKKSELIAGILEKIVTPQRQMIVSGAEGTLYHFHQIDGFVNHDLSDVIHAIDWGNVDIPAYPDPTLSGKVKSDAEKIKLVDAFEWVAENILDTASGNSVIGTDFFTYQKILPQMAAVMKGQKVLTGENPAAIRTGNRLVDQALNEFILFDRKPLMLVDENTAMPNRLQSPSHCRIPRAVLEALLPENLPDPVRESLEQYLFENPGAERLKLLDPEMKDKLQLFDQRWFEQRTITKKGLDLIKKDPFLAQLLGNAAPQWDTISVAINKAVINDDKFDIEPLLARALQNPNASADLRRLAEISKDPEAFKVYKNQVGDEYRLYKKKLLAELYPELFADVFAQLPVEHVRKISRALRAFYGGKLFHQIELLNLAFRSNPAIDFDVNGFFDEYSREYVKFVERREFLRLKVLSEVQKPLPGKSLIPVEAKSEVVDEIIDQFMNYLREERNQNPRHPHLVQKRTPDGKHAYYIPKDVARQMWKPQHILNQIDPQEFSRRIYLYNGAHENPDKFDKPVFRELWDKLQPASEGPMTRIQERDYYELYWSRIAMDDRGRSKPTNISFTLMGAPKIPVMIKNDLYWLIEEYIRLRAKGQENIKLTEILELRNELMSTGSKTRSRETFVDHGFEFRYASLLRDMTEMFDQKSRKQLDELRSTPIEQLIFEMLNMFEQQYEGPDRERVSLMAAMAKTVPLSVHKRLNSKFFTIFDKDNYPFTTFTEQLYRVWGIDEYGNPVRNEHVILYQTGQGFESEHINQNIAKKTAVLGMDTHTITSGRAEGMELNRPVEGCGYIAPTHLYENAAVMTYHNVFQEKGLIKNVGLFIRYFGFKGLKEAWENSKKNVTASGQMRGKNWWLGKWAYLNLFAAFGMVGATVSLVPALPVLAAIPVGLLAAWGLKRVLVTATRLLVAGAALAFNLKPAQTIPIQPGQKPGFRQKVGLIYRNLKFESFDVTSFNFRAVVTQFLSNLRSAVEDKAMQDIMTTAYIKDYLKPGEVLKSELGGVSKKDIQKYFVETGDFKKMLVREDINPLEIKDNAVKAVYQKAEKSRSVHLRMGSTGTGLPIFGVVAADDTEVDTGQKKRWYSSQVELVGQVVSYAFQAFRRAIKFSIQDARNNGQIDSRKALWRQPLQTLPAVWRGIRSESLLTRLANISSLAYPVMGVASDISALVLAAYLILGLPVFGPASMLAFAAFSLLGMAHYSRVFAHIYAAQKRTGHSKENIKDMMAYSEIQSYLLASSSLVAFINKTQMPFIQTPFGADFPILSLYHHKDNPSDKELQKFRTNPSSWQVLRALWKGMSLAGAARYWKDVIKGDIKGIAAYQTASRQQWGPVASRLFLNGLLAGVAFMSVVAGLLPVIFGGLTLVGLAPSIFAGMVFIWPVLKIMSIMRGLKLCAKTEGVESQEMYQKRLSAIKAQQVGKKEQVQP